MGRETGWTDGQRGRMDRGSEWQRDRMNRETGWTEGVDGQIFLDGQMD